MAENLSLGTQQSPSVRERLLSGEPVAFPSSTAVEERTIPAEWLIEAIRLGAPISVQNIRIVGEFDLRNMRVRGDIRLLSCEILEFANFSYAVFERTLRLYSCDFRKGVSFDSARLRSDVWFDESTFASPPRDAGRSVTLFNDAEFTGVVSADSVKFLGDASTSFQRARFASLLDFASARFEAPVDMAQIRVAGDLRFDRATFIRQCSLNRAVVAGSLGFTEAVFLRRSSLVLSGAEVDSGIDLSGAVLLGGLVAEGARFGSIDASRVVLVRGLLLDDVTVTGSITLNGARFGRRYFTDCRRLSVGGQLDLGQALVKGPLRAEDSVIGKALLAQGAHFQHSVTFDGLQAGSVNLTDCRFERKAKSSAPRFSRVTVRGEFNASRTRFQHGIVITDGRIGELTLDNVRSSGTVDIGWTTVSGLMSLDAARVRAKGTALNLQGVSVGKVAWFDGSRFAGNVSAIGLHVDQQFSWNRVITLGDTDFYELDVRRGAFMQGASFAGSLQLDSARLGADVYLGGTLCLGRATFDKALVAALHLGRGTSPDERAATFDAGLSLRNARLGYLNLNHVTIGDRPRVRRSRGVQIERREPVAALFEHSEVSGVANFTGAIFNVTASFYGAQFVGEALFQRVQFLGPGVTNFSTSTFKARAVFLKARLEHSADFSYARFEGPAIFRTRFGGNATFDMCVFGGAAEFSDLGTRAWERGESVWTSLDEDLPASSFSDASFVQARFAGDARFDSVKFAGMLDLRQATFLTLSLPSHRNRDTESDWLPRRIGLVGCRYQNVSLEHPENLLLRSGEALRLLEGYDRQPFAQLEDTLRRAGDERAADRVYLAGRRAEGKQKPMVSRVLDLAYGTLVNYGVRPWRLVALAILFIGFGAWYFSHPGTVQLKEDNEPNAIPYPVTWQEALNLGVSHFLPVSLPIKEYLVPSSQIVGVAVQMPGNGPVLTIRVRPSSVATVLQLLGWILVPIGVGAMTGLLMRKTTQKTE